MSKLSLRVWVMHVIISTNCAVMHCINKRHLSSKIKKVYLKSVSWMWTLSCHKPLHFELRPSIARIGKVIISLMFDKLSTLILAKWNSRRQYCFKKLFFVAYLITFEWEKPAFCMFLCALLLSTMLQIKSLCGKCSVFQWLNW